MDNMMVRSGRIGVCEALGIDTSVKYEAIIAEIKKLKESPWISVEDELPESYGNRYCTGTSPIVDVHADGRRWIDCYYDYDGGCFRCPDIDCIVRDVTHFMYAPKPPAGDK